jgi:hypothetical protein
MSFTHRAACFATAAAVVKMVAKRWLICRPGLGSRIG